MISSPSLQKISFPAVRFSENKNAINKLEPVSKTPVMDIDFSLKARNSLKNSNCAKIEKEFLFLEAYLMRKVDVIRRTLKIRYENEKKYLDINGVERALFVSQFIKGMVHHILNYLGSQSDADNLDYMRSKKIMQRVFNMMSQIDSNADMLFLMRNTYFFKDKRQSINNDLLSSQLSMQIDLSKFSDEDPKYWLDCLANSMLSEIEILGNVMKNYYENRTFCENEDLFDFFLFKFEIKKENSLLILNFLKRIYNKSEIEDRFYEVISEIDSNIEWLYFERAEDDKNYIMDYSSKKPKEYLEFIQYEILSETKKYRENMRSYFKNKENYLNQGKELAQYAFDLSMLRFRFMHGNILRVIDFFENNIRSEYNKYTLSNHFKDSIDRMSFHINYSIDEVKFYFYNKKSAVEMDKISLLSDNIKIIPLKECLYSYPEFLFRNEMSAILSQMEYFEEILTNDFYKNYFYLQGFLKKNIEILEIVKGKLSYISEKLESNEGYIYKKYTNSNRYQKNVSSIVNAIQSRKNWLHTLQNEYSDNNESIASD